MNAVITGATKGIGKAIAHLLAEKGFNLSICSRSESDLRSLATDLEQEHNVKCIYQATDVSKKAEVLAFAKYTQKNFEKVDVLINNAGVFIPGSCYNEEDGALEKMIDTNLYSAYYLSRAFIPGMISYGSGHIFNVCSVASITAYENGGSYSISKYALYGMTKNLREELKNKNIKVTAILPGATWSASWAGVDLPEERLMQATDIAKLVWAALDVNPSAVVEEIVIRPQEGDL